MSDIIPYLLPLTPLVISILFALLIVRRMRIYSSSGMFLRNPDDILDPGHSAVVCLGGMSLFPILLISLCLSMGISRWLLYYDIADYPLSIHGDRILQILAGGGLLYIVGLKHDMHGTFGGTRFLAMLVATAMFPLSGLWIRDLQGVFGLYAISPWLGIPLTIAISLYITEAIALMDDMDGLGAGVSAIAFAIFLLFSYLYGFTYGMLISSAGLGITLPYTLFKLFMPSWRRTLMGAAGSLPLGYILSYASLSIIRPATAAMPDGMLLIVFGVLLIPMIDLLRTIRSRVKDGRILQMPDRNLIQHRILRIGVPSLWVPAVIIALIGTLTMVNTLWMYHHLDPNWLLVLDLGIWLTIHVSANILIRRREERIAGEQWAVAYGGEVWETTIPTEVITPCHSPIADGVKRLFDLVASILLIILFSPLILLCSLLILCTDRGPIIYRQERIGRYGRPFTIYKFRSMRTDAESEGPALSHADSADDPRITPIGRFLRNHHLDELPQLYNVLKGDMSFIGYRPERKYYIDQIMIRDPRYAMLFRIRPGVTSYATLYNGYTDTIDKMLRRLDYDLYYLGHRSFFFDMGVLWRTFIAIVFGKRF